MPDPRSEALRNVSSVLNRIGDTDSVILKTPAAWLPLAL